MTGLKISKGKRIKVFLRNNIKYEGKVLEINESFLRIHDEKTDNEVGVNAAEIRNYEVVG